VTLRYRQVDVFAAGPYRGNGLGVFHDQGVLTSAQMQAVARELNQAESIFLSSTEQPHRVAARIFTPAEELPFAGHPLLGASAVLHLGGEDPRQEASWEFQLTGDRIVPVRSRAHGTSVTARMDQGPATFLPSLAADQADIILAALGLDRSHQHPSLPLQVVTTGLPYLIVPLRAGIGEARIVHPAFGDLLAALGARFAYLLDPAVPEGRNWDNTGGSEDPATGSAAGPAGAFLVKHGICRAGECICVRQGIRAGRPSELRVTVEPDGAAFRVAVEGDIWPVGEGSVLVPPP
jgi:trans-2,3-dihydro-3-hydroxyanthranilate isomerase